ncbi:MAG: zinc ribbon domain-containing protein [Thermoplasmata archaeon]
MLDLGSIIIIIAVLFIFIVIILNLNKTFRKRIEKSNLRDEAYNSVEGAKAISRILSAKGVKVDDANSVIKKAENLYREGDYTGAKALSDEAKRILDRSRQETLVNKEEREVKVVEKKEESYEDLSPTFVLQKKYPENYLAAKFSLEMAQSMYDSSGAEEREGASVYLQEARKAFERSDYSESLRYSIKTQKFLKKEIEELKCPRCGASVGPRDTYCWNCGAKLKMDRCPNCGAEVQPSDKFCRNCGFRLK